MTTSPHHRSIRKTLSPAPVASGFGAGTLIQCQDGVVPIEQVRQGDWVLTRLEQTGERTCRQVVRVTQFENRAVFRIRYSVVEEEDGPVLPVVVTAEHPFFVTGHDPEELRPREVREVGWIPAQDLQYGSLLALADGRTGWLQSVDPIWLTRTEGTGFIGKRDAEHGQVVDLRDGTCARIGGFSELADLLGVDDFNLRYESEEITDRWAYKATVYNLDVGDDSAIYAGDAGVRVRSAL